MLIRQAILKRIKTGEVSLAFRRWQRPTVKTGGTLKTAVGLLAIKQVEVITPEQISDDDIQQAGYSSKETLLNDIRKREGQLYRIQLVYAGEDPRIQLREKDDLTAAELTEIVSRLQKIDARADVPWTLKVMNAIKEHPKTPAVTLADITGFEKDWLKTHVRKLKDLGLTISHQPGYTLSPRGMAVLNHAQQNSLC
jgi:hypothetical protein